MQEPGAAPQGKKTFIKSAALKARNNPRGFTIVNKYRVFSAQNTVSLARPGALPQAVTFRAFGALVCCFNLPVQPRQTALHT
jgi:hypothetical protein